MSRGSPLPLCRRNWGRVLGAVGPRPRQTFGLRLWLLLSRLAFKASEHEGFVFRGSPEGRAKFERALKLLRKTDPRRYQRVRRHIRMFIEHPFRTGYWAARQVCDLCLWNQKSPAVLASAFVHEATHGYLDSLGIPYAGRWAALHETIAIHEELRFTEVFAESGYWTQWEADAFRRRQRAHLVGAESHQHWLPENLRKQDERMIAAYLEQTRPPTGRLKTFAKRLFGRREQLPRG